MDLNQSKDFKILLKFGYCKIFCHFSLVSLENDYSFVAKFRIRRLCGHFYSLSTAGLWKGSQPAVNSVCSSIPSSTSSCCDWRVRSCDLTWLLFTAGLQWRAPSIFGLQDAKIGLQWHRSYFAMSVEVKAWALTSSSSSVGAYSKKNDSLVMDPPSTTFIAVKCWELITLHFWPLGGKVYQHMFQITNSIIPFLLMRAPRPFRAPDVFLHCSRIPLKAFRILYLYSLKLRLFGSERAGQPFSPLLTLFPIHIFYLLF